MMGSVSLRMIGAPLASVPVDLSAILAPLAWIITALLAVAMIGILVGRERPGRPARFISPTITLEEEEELLRRLAA